MPRHRRRARRPSPIVVTGRFTVAAAIISTIGVVIAAVISRPSPGPPTSISPTISSPLTAPTTSRSSFRSTAVQSSSQAPPTHQSETPTKPRPNPAPTLLSPIPVKTPDASPTRFALPTASTTNTEPYGISIQANFEGCADGFCLAPLSLILSPIVLENGMYITDGGCQVNWTIHGSSLAYQTSTPCAGDFRTGLVLGVGTYKIIAEAITSSGTEAYASFSLIVENSPIAGDPIPAWTPSLLCDLPNWLIRSEYCMTIYECWSAIGSACL